MLFFHVINIHEGSLKCNKCDAKFDDLQKVTKHRDQHPNGREITFGVCFDPFEEQGFEGSSDRLRCKFCQKVFNLQENAYRHEQEHHLGRRYLCLLCGWTASQKGSGIHPCRKSNVRFPWVFVYDLEFSTRSKLPIPEPCCLAIDDHYSRKHHIAEVHHGRYFSCNVCKKKMKSINDLMDHKNAHADRVSFNVTYEKVDESQTASTNHQSNIIHQSRSEPVKRGRPKLSHGRVRSKFGHKCKYCTKSFSSAQYRDHHIEDMHNGRVFTCKKCNAKINTYGKMLFHKRQCAGTFAKHYKSRRKDFGDAHRCSSCDKSFSSDLCLQRHIEEVHRGRMSLCPNCGITNTCLGHMWRHIRDAHSPSCPPIIYYENVEKRREFPKSFPLQQCCKLVKGLNKKRDHILDTHGQRSFTCQKCSAEILSLKELASHSKSHNDDVVYYAKYEGQSAECKGFQAVDEVPQNVQTENPKRANDLGNRQARAKTKLKHVKKSNHQALSGSNQRKSRTREPENRSNQAKISSFEARYSEPGFDYENSGILISHDKWHCSSCDTTLNLKNRIRHVEEVHRGRKCLCTTCGMYNANIPLLNRHIKDKHNGKSQLIIIYDLKKASEIALAVTSESCCQKFEGHKFYGSARRHHIAETHLERYFRCKICQETISSYRDLGAHSKLHREHTIYTAEYGDLQVGKDTDALSSLPKMNPRNPGTTNDEIESPQDDYYELGQFSRMLL